jgi:hypothetical protein
MGRLSADFLGGLFGRTLLGDSLIFGDSAITTNFQRDLIVLPQDTSSRAAERT